jgi:hypothetical protein
MNLKHTQNAKKFYLQTAKANCKGNYSDPPNALCADSIQAIADVSFS